MGCPVILVEGFSFMWKRWFEVQLPETGYNLHLLRGVVFKMFDLFMSARCLEMYVP